MVTVAMTGGKYRAVRATAQRVLTAAVRAGWWLRRLEFSGRSASVYLTLVRGGRLFRVRVSDHLRHHWQGGGVPEFACVLVGGGIACQVAELSKRLA